MTKFKKGDKVRLKKSAIDWGDCYYNCTWTFPDEQFSTFNASIKYFTDQYPDDFELAEEKLADPSPKKHIHHDMIVEWAKDPSRIVQFYDDEYYDCGWKDVVGQPPMWHTDKRYRFKPTEPERIFPTTSFTDDELYTIVAQGDSLCTADDYRNVANAAIKIYILEQENKE